VAPLGTALTADQLALLWRMADEPVLCFDGDGAGRRAAYRAVDVALPLIKPGKSLKFAALPEGHDPDDLVRSGGRAAVEEVLAAAKPLADVLWMRETEAGGLGTPERRAALEARMNEVTATITDESVRRHYRSEFNARLRRLFDAERQPAARRPFVRRDPRPGGNWPQARGGAADRFRKTGAPGLGPMMVSGQPYVVASAQMAMSPVHRGHRAAISRREALILQAVLNHPWLLHEHLEDLAGLDFSHPETEKVKACLIDIFSHDGAPDREAMRAELSARGLGALVARVEKAITTSSVWGVGPEAAPDDVLMTWNQLVALHRQWHSLIKELKDAEQALGQDPTEANNSWLQDVKARLSAMDGTEALIEGFGASSGRSASSF
jgi:DNA primase